MSNFLSLLFNFFGNFFGFLDNFTIFGDFSLLKLLIIIFIFKVAINFLIKKNN